MRDFKDRLALFEGTMRGNVPVRDYDTLLKWCVENEFFSQPASTKYHGNYPGGLFDHSYNVAKALCVLTQRNGLEWERPDSPCIIGMFHDICKTDNYMQDANEIYEYNTETLLKGHGDKSVMILASLTTLTEEEVMCIRYHMGAFTDSGEWNYYTRAIHKYPNVLWSHHADMIAAHIMER